jgi:hypothetical protein
MAIATRLQSLPPHPLPVTKAGADPVDQAVGPLLLSEEDTGKMAKAIYASRIEAYEAAYQEAELRLGLPPNTAWHAPASVLEEQSKAALEAADQITATYERELRAAASRLLDAGVSGDDLHAALQDWGRARKGWKSEQISRYETGRASERGTMDMVGALREGEYEDQLAEMADWSMDEVRITVLPAGAETEDLCMVYAGAAFSLDDAWDIPEFPIHANCPHEKVVLYGGADDLDIDPDEAAEMSPADWANLLGDYGPESEEGSSGAGGAGTAGADTEESSSTSGAVDIGTYHSPEEYERQAEDAARAAAANAGRQAGSQAGAQSH